MATEILELLVRANLVAAAATLLVLLLRHPIRLLAGPKIAYALWALIPLAALAAFLPAQAPIPIVFEIPAGLPTALSWMTEPQSPALAHTATTQVGDPAGEIVSLWLIGALAVAAFMAWRHLRLVHHLGPLTRRAEGVMQSTRTRIGPAVLGVLAPRIIVPADFDHRFCPNERQMILAHERQHLASGDAQVNALIVLLQCLCWFNPFVHLAAHHARLDQELACDAVVLRAQPQARRAYAEALLKTQLAEATPAFGCGWPVRGEHPLKQRLSAMRRPPPGPVRRVAGTAAIVLAASASAYAAWAARPAEVAATVVAEMARIDRGAPRVLEGRIVSIGWMAPASEITLVEHRTGDLWTVVGKGKAGLALADWAKLNGPDISIEGYLQRNGACGPDTCFIHLGPSPVAAPAEPVLPVPDVAAAAADPVGALSAPTPYRPAPGLPDHAEDLSPDPTAPVQFAGAITKVEWRYPNAVIHMTSFHDGRRWTVAGGAPANLARTGLTPEVLAPGSQVMIRGYRQTDKACAPECKVVGASLAFEDGAGRSLWGLE